MNRQAMKKTYHILVLLSAMGFALACTEKGPDTAVKDQLISFKAQAPVLKTVVARDDTTMYWSAYDSIAVYMFDADGCVEKDVAQINYSSVSLKTATFYPATFKTLDYWKEKGTGLSVFRAYGPVTELPEIEGYQIPVEIPSVQTGHFGRHQILCSSEGQLSSVVNMVFAPVTALFELRLNLTPESLSESCRIAKIEMEFTGGNVAGPNTLDLKECRLIDPAIQNTMTVVPEEPVRVSKALAQDKPSHFNQYVSCALIPSETVENVRITVYDVKDNMFETELAIPSRVLNAGERYRCDAYIYLDKVIANDVLDSEGDEGFGPDWEIELQ
jgi:hypothetical protein